MKKIISVIGAIAITIVVLVAFIPVQQEKQDDKWTAPAMADKMKNPVVPDEKSIAVSKKLFTKECAKCHGEKGDGEIPEDKLKDLGKAPGNFTTADFQEQSDGAIFWKISEGKKPMPSFKKEFSNTERWQMVSYLRTLGTTVNPKKKN